MPTATDEKLAADLTEFRLEVEKRFGSIDKTLGDFRGDFREFRSAVERELKFARWIGVFFASLLVATIIGAGRVIWDAATINAEVNYQGTRLEKVEKRLDGIDAKLDTLVRRGEPKTKGE